MANVFESGARRVIPAVTVYLKKDQHLLMIHRTGKKDGSKDFHQGRWNGLGGKLEVNESPEEAARREMIEEAGLDLPLDRYRPMGFLLFPNFKPHKNEDWSVVVFVADLQDGDPEPVLGSGPEGDLHWVPEGQVLDLPLWPGDVHFLPFVLERRLFSGTIWYQDLSVARHAVQPL